VFDLTRILAGPTCTQLLGDLGADVLKIERPREGDDTRKWGPPYLKDEAGQDTSESAYYLSSNRNKRSVAIDLAQAEGQALAKRLLAHCDVLVENFKAGGLAKYGLSYNDLKGEFPLLVYCSITGFGQDGPYAGYKTPDLVGNAMGGLLYISGDPKMTPCNPPETQSYYYASLFASYGVTLALWQRETRGIGAWIDASVQASMALHEHVAFNYSAEGRVMKRAGSQHQHNAPANLFKCKNGWIALFVTQNHWPILLKVWKDHEPELDDPKWINSNLRRQNADYINAQVTSFTSRYLKEDLAELMQKHGIPGLPVNSPSDFMQDPHIQARQFFSKVTHPVLGTFVQAGNSFMVDGQRTGPAAAPIAGQHNQEVFCGELGISAEELAAFAAAGII
jgi:crotonobetainyl-CoA:carnitine CoA-transferase CaiB-like acyl-CoA transferase